MMMMMAKVTKRCAVQPATPPLQLNETLITEVDSVDRQHTDRVSPADVSDRSCGSLVVNWFSSMKFDDKGLEQMYDRYVVKFSEYSVNMLLMLLSLVCLTELIFYFAVGATSHHIVTAVLMCIPCFTVCLSLCLSVCFSVCLSVYV